MLLLAHLEVFAHVNLNPTLISNFNVIWASLSLTDLVSFITFPSQLTLE